MKKILLTIALMTVAVLLVACGGSDKDVKDAPTDVPPAPSVPTTDTPTETAPSESGTTTGTIDPEAATEDSIELEAPGEAFASERSVEVSGLVGNVRCTSEGRKLTFTLNNDGEKTWSLDQKVPFPPPADLVPAKIFINNYEANRFNTYYEAETGDALFGPNEKFSANCGGVDMLAPGEQVECSLYPVPLKTADDFEDQNRIWVDVPGDFSSAYFTCN